MDMYKALINLFLLFNISSAYTVVSSKFVNEAEIKHGRVAMVSSVLIPFLIKKGCKIIVTEKNFEELSDYIKGMCVLFVGNSGAGKSTLSSKIIGQKLKTNELFVGRIAMAATLCELTNEFFLQEPVLKFTKYPV